MGEGVIAGGGGMIEDKSLAMDEVDGSEMKYGKEDYREVPKILVFGWFSQEDASAMCLMANRITSRSFYFQVEVTS